MSRADKPGGSNRRRSRNDNSAEDAFDAIEYCFDQGFTDGLPVVPPTEDRIAAVLAAWQLDPQEVVAAIPPSYRPATMEKIATNAVMAGCHASYLPVVIAGVRAMVEELFNLHGIQATTHFASPLFIVNGPVRQQLSINCGANVFGQGWRANATIGRALRLIIVNIGEARPGGIDMSTMGHPGKLTYLIGENEEENPWEPLHVEMGYAPEDSTITVFAGEAPHGISDHGSRDAEGVVATLGWSMANIWNHKAYLLGETLLVIGPEHAKTIGGSGWTKDDIRQYIFDHIRKPLNELRSGRDGGEGMEDVPPYAAGDMIPKFRSPEEIKIVVAGGTAGRFSACIPGWTGKIGSRMSTVKIDLTHGR